MKKYIFSILAVSALVIAACNKELPENEQVVPEEPGVEYEFTASIDEDTPETSASIDFVSTGKMTWTGSDQIAVWNASTNAFVVFSVKSVSADGYTATFNANISGTPSFGKAYYPASIAGSSENSVVLPSSYASVAAVAEGFPMMSDTVTPGQPVTFKHLGSFLKLTVNNAPAAATKFTVTSMTTGKFLSGTFTTNFNNGAPTLTASAGNASVTVPKGSPVYMPIPADSYSLRIEVKDDDGFNYFRRDVAGEKTFARATLKKANITVIAPTQYYVSVESPQNQYTSNQNIPLIQVDGNTFESVFNADMNAAYSICDNFNIGNVNGIVASGMTTGKAENNDEWGIVGTLVYASWAVSNPLLLDGHIGNWFYKKGVRFSNSTAEFKFYKKAGGSSDWNRDQVGGGTISLGTEATVYGFGSGQDNIKITGVSTSSDYDVWINFTSMKVFVVLSSANTIPPSCENGAFCLFRFNKSTNDSFGIFDHARISNSFDVNFMNNAFCFIGGLSNNEDQLMTYNGNHIFSCDITVPSGGVSNSWFQFRQQGTWGWYRWGSGVAVTSNSRWGTSAWQTSVDNTITLPEGDYTIYVNAWSHYDNKQIKFCIQPKL